MSNINEKNQGPRWYVAHTYTGYENKVKDSIEKIVENRGLGHLIYDVKVPSVSERVLDENGLPKDIEPLPEETADRRRALHSRTSALFRRNKNN